MTELKHHAAARPLPESGRAAGRHALSNGLAPSRRQTSMGVQLGENDSRLLAARANELGVSKAELLRQLLRCYLLSRPYLAQPEIVALRDCGRALCKASVEVNDSAAGLLELLKAGYVNECFGEIAESSLALRGRIESLLERVEAILDAAESRAVIARVEP